MNNSPNTPPPVATSSVQTPLMPDDGYTPLGAELTVELSFNTNSAITGLSEAAALYYALDKYKEEVLIHLIKSYGEDLITPGEERFSDAAYEWNLYKTIQNMQHKITEKSIELAELNYWAYERLSNPVDYERISAGQQKMTGNLVTEFLKTFGLGKEVSHD